MGYRDHVESNQVGISGLFSVLTRFVVLDVINDPFHISRNLISKKSSKYQSIKKKTIKEKNGNEIELNAAQARIEFWRKAFNLSIPEKFNGKELPRNTLIGRPYDYKTESPVASNASFLLFPVFPSHLSLPCKPGESVWVFHESTRAEHTSTGWWLSKVVDFGFCDDVNIAPSTRSIESSNWSDIDSNSSGAQKNYYEYRSGKRLPDGRTNKDFSPIVVPDENFFENLILKSPSGRTIIREPVPRFKKRPSDLVLEGSNNSLIVLGTDRNGPSVDIQKTDDYFLSLAENQKALNEKSLLPGSDEKEGAGSIDLVVGRGQTSKTMGEISEIESVEIQGKKIGKELSKHPGSLNENEGDPDFVNDKSRVLISQRTKIDQKLNISETNQKFGLSDSENGDGSVMTKSDKIRIIARKDAQILVKDDNGNDVTTIVAKNDGQIIIKSKNNVTLNISPDGKVTLDSNGDVIVNPGPGMVRLGGEDANNAILCQIAGSPIVGSMGTTFGTGGTFGVFSSKVMVK